MTVTQRRRLARPLARDRPFHASRGPRARATRRWRRSARTAGLPAQRAVAPPRPVLGAAAALRLRRLDRGGHAAVAADRRRGRGGQEASPNSGAVAARDKASAAAHRRRPVDGVLLLDKPVRRVVERGAAAREAALSRREGRAHRARSIRWPRDCCRCASARRPSSRSCLLDAPKRYHGHRPLRRRRRPPATPKARCAPRGRSRSTRGELERRCARFIGRIAQMPPAYSALKFEGRAVLRVRARRRRTSRATPRDVEIHALRLVDWRRARRRRRRRVQQGHVRPRAGRGHRRGARLRRAPRRAAAHGDRRLPLADALTLRAPRRHDRRRSALGALLPVDVAGRRPAARRARRRRGRRASGRGRRSRRPGARTATCAVFADGAFLGRGRGRAAAWRSRAGWSRSGPPTAPARLDSKASFRLII